MNNYICVNDTIRKNDSQTIIAAINLALTSGIRKVHIPKMNLRTGEEL